MIKTPQLVLLLASLLSLVPRLCSAQPLRPRLGEDKALAAETMLGVAFPGTTPVWDAYLYAASANGTRARISLSNIATISNGQTQEFVAGLQDFDAGGKQLSRLQHGDSPSAQGSRPTVVAVAKNTTGSFQAVASLVLDPNHIFSAVSNLDVNPNDPSQVVVISETTDLLQNQLVDITWYVVLDANLKILQKWPTAIQVEGTGDNSGALLRTLTIVRTSTGIAVTNLETRAKLTEIPCSAICDPTLQQLLASN